MMQTSISGVEDMVLHQPVIEGQMLMLYHDPTKCRAPCYAVLSTRFEKDSTLKRA